MWYAEDDENDGHHGEWCHQDEISTVESPKPGAPEEWAIFVRNFDKSPTSNSEFISTHKTKQTGDDGEIDTLMGRLAMGFLAHADLYVPDLTLVP